MIEKQERTLREHLKGTGTQAGIILALLFAALMPKVYLEGRAYDIGQNQLEVKNLYRLVKDYAKEKEAYPQSFDDLKAFADQQEERRKIFKASRSERYRFVAGHRPRLGHNLIMIYDKLPTHGQRTALLAGGTARQMETRDLNTLLSKTKAEIKKRQAADLK